MNYIYIKENDNKFIISAIKIQNSNGFKKIPHPFGHETIEFDTIEEAQDAIKRAGFEYVLPDGNIPYTQKTEPVNYDKEILNILIEKTKDLNSNVVACAIETLSELNVISCLDLFIEKIGEDNDKIRNNSINAIVKFGETALEPLLNSLSSKNWVTRNSAVICLDKLIQEKNISTSRMIDALLDMINDENPIIKCSAIKALGNIYKAKNAK